jgi:hypothetical protein
MATEAGGLTKKHRNRVVRFGYPVRRRRVRVVPAVRFRMGHVGPPATGPGEIPNQEHMVRNLAVVLADLAITWPHCPMAGRKVGAGDAATGPSWR